MIKKIALLISLPLLLGCAPSGKSQQTEGVIMRARVLGVGQYIDVEVTESEYTSGPHRVITDRTTEYLGVDGERIGREEIRVGDMVEILYGGQVMMSYPPMIVAMRIRHICGSP